MNQAVMIINCYLYGATAVMLLVLLLIVYLRGQVTHFPNPFAKKNLMYRHLAQAKGVLFGKKFGLLAYSPEQDEGHILVLGPSGTGKTSALLIPTLRSWQGTALVVDISGDISANVNTANKIVFDPTSESCIPYDVFASINAVADETERQERLEQLAYLLLPDKANDSEAGIFFCKNGRKMITAALICYYGMGWGFVEICEFFLGHDWRSLLNDIAKQQNPIANMFISSFAGASEQNTQYLGFAAELELVGTLVQRPGGVAAALELNIGIGQVAPACLADRHAVALVFDILGASLDFIQGHTVQGKGYAGQLGFVQFHPRRFAIRKGQVQGFDVGKIAADSGSVHSQSLCIRGGQLGTSFNRKSCHVRIDGQEEAVRFINKLCRAVCCRNGQ